MVWGMNPLQIFLAVLAALLVFGGAVLAYQAMSGPSVEECSNQKITASYGVGEVDPRCYSSLGAP